MQTLIFYPDWSTLNYSLILIIFYSKSFGYCCYLPVHRCAVQYSYQQTCSWYLHLELNLKHSDPSYHHNHSHRVLLILHPLTLHLDLNAEFMASLLSFLLPFVPILGLAHHHHHNHIPNSVSRTLRIFTLSIPVPGPWNRGHVGWSTASMEEVAVDCPCPLDSLQIFVKFARALQLQSWHFTFKRWLSHGWACYVVCMYIFSLGSYVITGYVSSKVRNE